MKVRFFVECNFDISGIERLARQYRLQSLPIKEEIQKVTRPIIMKPCPPQDLALSPESAKKMLVPSITIVESSPITESQPQMCYPLKSSDKSKFRTSALQNLKSIGPSLQSFVIATAKGLKANFPSSTKTDKSDSVKEKKSKTSPPLQRQSSSDSLSLSSIRNVLQKSPKLPRQASLSEIKEKPHVSKGFKSLSDESSDVSFESAKNITVGNKSEIQRDSRIDEERGDSEVQTQEEEQERSPSDQQDVNEITTSEITSTENMKKMSPFYPTVTNTEFPIQKMTPPITRQTKVSFALPEDSDSSSVSSGVSSLTSPWSSPQVQRPALSRQKPIETEITVSEEITEDQEKTKESHLVSQDDFVGQMEENSPSRDTVSLSTTSTREEAPLSFTGSQPVSVSEPKLIVELPDQSKSCSSVDGDQAVQADEIISEDYHSGVVKSLIESSSQIATSIATTKEIEFQKSSNSVDQEEDKSKHQLKLPENKPKSLSSSSSEGDIVNNLLLRENDGISATDKDESVKKASSTDCLSPDSGVEETSPKSPREPFKSSIGSSALLLSSLSPVLPRGHTYYSHSLSSLNANSILAGNVPMRPGRSNAVQNTGMSYTPLNSFSQSVPNLRDSQKRQTSALPCFRQSLPETSFLEEEAESTGARIMSASVEGIPRTDTDSETELNKKSLQIGIKSKEGPSKISTNPAVSRTKIGQKLQSSKPARDSQRPPKGPSGIVMGKAAIQPNRGGPRSTASTRKPGPSQDPKKPAEATGTSDEACKKKKTSPSRKSPGALATAESHNYSCATCGRRRSAASKLLEEAQQMSDKEKCGTDREKPSSERRLSVGSGKGRRNSPDERKSSETKSKPPKLNKDRTPRFV